MNGRIERECFSEDIHLVDITRQPPTVNWYRVVGLACILASAGLVLAFLRWVI